MSTFLPSSCCVELSGPVEIRSTHVEHEVMYSRAELITEHAPPIQQQEPITATEQQNSLLSPSSEGGLSYHEEPSSVPEPTLPEGFKTDELVWERSESLDEDSKAEDTPFSKYKDGADDTEDKYFPAVEERSGPLLDESSEAEGAFRTAEQSMDDVDTGMIERDQKQEETPSETEKGDDSDMDETVIAQVAISEDHDLPKTESEDIEDRPEEPVLPLEAENASEKSSDSASSEGEGEVYVAVGDEISLDRREEMIDAVEKATLTRDQIKTRGDNDGQTCEPTAAPTAEAAGFPSRSEPADDVLESPASTSDATERGEMNPDDDHEEGTCRPLISSSALCSS